MNIFILLTFDFYIFINENKIVQNLYVKLAIIKSLNYKNYKKLKFHNSISSCKSFKFDFKLKCNYFEKKKKSLIKK